MYLLSCDHSGNAIAPVFMVVQRVEARSKTLIPFESRVTAAIDFPSGDQRGPHSPSDPGMTDTVWLARLRMRKSNSGLVRPSGLLQKTTSRPSGDQLGSVSPSRSSDIRRWGT